MRHLFKTLFLFALVGSQTLFAIEKRDEDRDLFDRNRDRDDFNEYDYPPSQPNPYYYQQRGGNPRLVAINEDEPEAP